MDAEVSKVQGHPLLYKEFIPVWVYEILPENTMKKK